MKRNVVAVKLGGSSFVAMNDFGIAANYLIELGNAGYRPVAIVSAPKGVSDQLIALYEGKAKADDFVESVGIRYKHFSLRELEQELARIYKLFQKTDANERRDEKLSLGENISGVILSGLLRAAGVESKYYDGRQAGIKVRHGRPDVIASCRGIMQSVVNEGIPVIGGYAGEAENGGYELMGRNSTDITQVLVGKALGAMSCHNIKDTPVKRMQPRIELDGDGVIAMETDTIPSLSYDEAVNLGWRQAEVVHPRAVDIARESGLRIIVKRMDSDEETLISKSTGTTNEYPVAAISARLCNSIGIVDPDMDADEGTGYLAEASKVFATNRVSVLDNSSVGTAMSFIVPVRQNKTPVDAKELRDEVRQHVTELGYNPTDTIVRKRFAISAVGSAIKNHPGALRRVLKPFEDCNVPVRMAHTSDEGETLPVINVYMDVDRSKIEQVLDAFCDEFKFREGC